MKGLAFAVKALISALALYLAFRLVHFAELQQRFYRLDLAWIVAAQTALVVQIVLAAARWQIIAEWCGAELTMLQSLRFTLIGAFFNQTLPSTVGGDAARMWFLARAAGHSKPAVYSVLMDRAAGLIWLAALVLVCLPWSMRLIESPVGRATLVLIGVGGVAGPLVLFALTQAGRKTLVRWRVTRHLAEILAVAWTTLTSRRAGVSIAAISITIHLMSVLLAWFTAKAIGSPLGLVQSMLLVPPVILIAAIPISIAGWGVREGAMITAFSYAGLPESDALAISVLFGAGAFIIGAIGGLVWIFSPDRKRPTPPQNGEELRGDAPLRAATTRRPPASQPDRAST
jgi:uncharacterized protein (TIRG00374 family)